VRKGKINIAIVGLGFGSEFVPIYQQHPHANLYAICQRSRKKLDAVGDAFGVGNRYTDYRELLKDPQVDAVHINTPIPDHAWMSIEGLKNGKHVACTVPMATSIADCQKIVMLQKTTGFRYMMMETAVCPRISLHARALRQRRAGQNPVPASEPSTRHGRLAQLLAGIATHVVRHALRRAGVRLDECHRRIRLLLRFRYDSPGADQEISIAVRG